jgi:hypothetical protein
MPRGRRPRLTPTLQQAIVTAIAGGVPFEAACRMAGVRPTEAHEWRQRGEGTHSTRPCTPLYADFAEALARARAQDEARRILRLNQAAQGGALIYEKVTTFPDGREVREVRHAEPNVQADMFHLERAYRERWGRSLQADVTLQIQRAAQSVADELGIDVALVLREAQTYLLEERRGDRPH